MQVKCNICGQITSKQGMTGHFRFKHEGKQLSYEELGEEYQENNQKSLLPEPKKPTVSLDFNERFNKIIEMKEKEAYLRFLENFGKPQQEAKTNNVKEILEVMQLLKQENPNTRVKDIMQTLREARDLASEFGGKGGVEDELFKMLPLMMSRLPQPQQPTQPQPQPKGEGVGGLGEEGEGEIMDENALVDEIIELIPPEIKQKVKEKVYTLDDIRKLAYEKLGLLKVYFKRMYGEELTPDLMEILIEKGYNKLTL